MYVRSALSVMKAVQANNHEASTYTHTKTTYPPKCEHGTSDQIFSSRKRRTLAATSLHKPSSDEVLATEQKMARVEIQVCGICLREKDGKQAKTSNGLPSPSVLCAWVHLSCAQFTSGDDQETYSCDFCLTHVAS